MIVTNTLTWYPGLNRQSNCGEQTCGGQFPDRDFLTKEACHGTKGLDAQPERGRPEDS